MSLLPNEEIGKEIHPYTTQFIKVESGVCTVIINGISFTLKDGGAVMIPPNTLHNIINIDKNPLKLYTIYSPPEHHSGLEQKTKPIESKGGGKNIKYSTMQLYVTTKNNYIAIQKKKL